MTKIDSKEALIQAAKSVFARLGYDGTTVKEIADTAGVNVSLVSYHFEGKEGLYRTCLEMFGRDRLAFAERVLKEPGSLEDFKIRIRLFVEEFFTCHIQEPEISQLLHRECISQNSLIKDIFMNVFVKVFDTLAAFVASAQEKGIVRKDIDTKISTALFFGGLVHFVRMRELQKELIGVCIDDAAFREQVVQHAIQNFIEGVV